ncbi:MAG: class I mannose-6-phosphate isomerase [Phycisphaeraceae bacterium]|nr:MAG: class I mannose-6-phosphate isomerase [Phycisphaeraceae bacterium]
MTEPYPLTFEPILKQKVWGGRRLARYGKALEPGAKYGESWELADLASTSISGGGGGAAVSVICNGPLAGRTIGDAIALWGESLLGKSGMAGARAFGGQTGAGRPIFPLLLKFLDACEHLSVQVHPSAAYAAAHPGAHLKTESWYVIEAEPGSLPSGEPVAPTIFQGLKPGVTAESFEAHICDATVAIDLANEPAIPGNCHTLPSGTVHALGAGVLVAEVQTPSDTTFRVYDWVREYERSERELHIKQALACIDFADAGPTPAVDALGGGRAAATGFYTMDVVLGGSEFEPGRAVAVMVLAGRGSIEGGTAGVPVGAGTTVLVPAGCGARLVGDGLTSIAVGLG